MDNRGTEKVEVNGPPVDEKYNTNGNPEKYLQDNASHYDDDKRSEEIKTFGGDTALANAPWKYKIIALVTALMFPCKYNKMNYQKKNSLLTHLYPIFSRFSFLCKCYFRYEISSYYCMYLWYFFIIFWRICN